MKEIFEFRIFKDHYDLLSKPNPAVFNGIVWILKIEKDDPLFAEVKQLNDSLRKYNEVLYSYTDIKRIYSAKEIEQASLFHFWSTKMFEPSAEESGTLYDYSLACHYCGCGENQIGPLVLKSSSIPKVDISRNISGEIVVSDKFVDSYNRYNLKGANFGLIETKRNKQGFQQLLSAKQELKLSKKTQAGVDIFNDFPKYQDEIYLNNDDQETTRRIYYHCPNGHLLGGNLISEVFVLNQTKIDEYDYFTSNLLIGAKMGVLRPEPLHLCSSKFRKMVIEEGLKGFTFEVAHVE